MLETTGAYLAKGAYLPSFPEIKTQIQSQVNDALKAAWAAALASINRRGGADAGGDALRRTGIVGAQKNKGSDEWELSQTDTGPRGSHHEEG